MRNVTTLTKMLGTDPIVIELDQYDAFKEAFKRMRMRVPRGRCPKNVAIIKRMVDADTYQPAILFGIISKQDERGMNQITTPFYYVTLGNMTA